MILHFTISKLTHFSKILYKNVILIALFTCYPRKYVPNFGYPRTLMSPFLFLLAIDWVMKTYTAQKQNGIQWTLWTQLDYLDFADDLDLFYHNQQQMQENCGKKLKKIGLNIHRAGAKYRSVRCQHNPIKLEGKALEEVESFAYLGSIVEKQGGTSADKRSESVKPVQLSCSLKRYGHPDTCQPTQRSDCSTPM